MSLPNKHKMLEELEVMVQAADKVSAENNKGQRDFGHLIVLVRDVGGSERAEEVKRLVLDNEEAETGRTKLAQRRALDERNSIRDGLREGFASITFHAMPRPHPQCGGEKHVYGVEFLGVIHVDDHTHLHARDLYCTLEKLLCMSARFWTYFPFCTTNAKFRPAPTQTA